MWKMRLLAIPSLFIVANSISWFSLNMNMIMQIAVSNSLERIFAISGAYFASLLISAIIGAILISQKIEEKTFLSAWILIGVISGLLFYFFSANANLTTLLLLSLFLGFSTGLGIPSCLSIFANQTKIEKRGRFGAIMFFVIQILTASILIPLIGLETNFAFLIISVWRLSSIASIFFYKIPPTILKEERKTSLATILRKRSFIIYFLPWFLFTLVNFIEAPIFERYVGQLLYNDYTMVTFLISSFSGILGGFLCDIKGRKVTGILGFILLGIGYAFLSFLSEGPGKQLSQYLYLTFDGIAWGILYVTFIFVIWGDLSEQDDRKKYYLLGGMPFLFSGLIQMLVQPFAGFIPISTSFSLATFFLFMAILPLLYAPELLPEKVIKERDLRTYVERALKKVETETEKWPKDTPKAEEDDSENVELFVDELEEAERLAEQHY
jgi:MFS family permease